MVRRRQGWGLGWNTTAAAAAGGGGGGRGGGGGAGGAAESLEGESQGPLAFSENLAALFFCCSLALSPTSKRSHSTPAPIPPHLAPFQLGQRPGELGREGRGGRGRHF